MRYFKNNNSYDLVLPDSQGTSFTLLPNKAVGGDFYEILNYSGFLTEINYVPVFPELVYTYGEQPPGTVTGDIKSISVTSPLTVVDVAGDLTLGVNLSTLASSLPSGSILATKIADGQVVKSLNSLKDAVTVEAGTGIRVDNAGQSITIVNTNPVLISASGTAPLTLTLSEDKTQLTGSIEITAAASGGAVALQSSLPSLSQLGNIDITGIFSLAGNIVINDTYETMLQNPAYLYIKQLSRDTSDYIRLQNNTGLIFAVTSTGLVTGQETNFNLATVRTQLTIGSGNTVTTFTYAGNDIHFNTSIYDIVTLKENATIKGAVTAVPLIDFTNDSSTVPTIRLKGNGLANTSYFFEAKNRTDEVVCSLKNDGAFYAKSFTAGSMALKSRLDIAGSYTLADTPDIYSFLGNAVGGVITYNLPLLDASSLNGRIYVFTKIDASANAVVLIASSGQTINGLTQKNLTTAFASVTLQAYVDSLTNTYFWVII